MKISANGKTIEAIKITEGMWNFDGEARPTIAIAVKGGITNEEVDALACGVIDIDNGYKVYKGFTGVVDLELLLYKPSDADLVMDRTADLQKGLDTAKAELEAAKVELAAEKERLEIAKAALIGAQIELPGEVAQKLAINKVQE